MPNDEANRRNGDQKSWADWKQDVFEAIEDLDDACANARQVIYRLRPLVRPKSERRDDEQEQEEEPRQPAPFRNRRRERRGR